MYYRFFGNNIEMHWLTCYNLIDMLLTGKSFI